MLSREIKRNQTEKALWIGSFTANNVQAIVQKSAKQKATTILEPHTFNLYGKRAVIAVPQGGIVALLELAPNNNQHKKSVKNGYRHNFSVLIPVKLQSFTNIVSISKTESLESNKNSYYLSQLGEQGEVSASIVTLPKSFEQRERWVNFIEVSNLATLLRKTQDNGGKVIYQTILFSSIILLASLAMFGYENTSVSGSVSYDMGYGYPMYYGHGGHHHTDIIVVKPPRKERPRPKRR